MTHRRRLLALSLLDRHVSGLPHGARPLTERDASALARLMFDAYRGTIDDAGESLEDAHAEIGRTFEGAYGAMLWAASFAVPDPEAPGSLLSASVVTTFRDAPLLAYSITHPLAQRRGLAAQLIVASADALTSLGHAELRLVVTAGNSRAERLYERLGFRETSG